MNKLNFIAYIGDILFGSGEKRKKFSITNILYILCAFAATFGLIKLYENRLDTNDGWLWFLSWAGIIFCALLALEFLLVGVVAQCVLLICSLLGSFFSNDKGNNLVAFILSLISLGATLGGAILFYNFLL